jgi:8-oxo-dGTP pyrophosphatase MutT (NUDIX family)
MWLFTTFGFFSVVRAADDEPLTIRGRTRGDLERLRRCSLPQASAPMSGAGTDSPWRMRCAPDALAGAMARIVADVDYPNFKDEVARGLGPERSRRYHRVWSALYGMPEDLPEPAPDGWEGLPWAPAHTPRRAPAFGGVVLDERGRLLLREVANHFDGTVWTFAKGRPERGEAPRQAALREVREELGVEARLLFPLHGAFTGSTSVTHFFLMTVRAREVDMRFRAPETARLRWASRRSARELLGQTTNATARRRDLQVLEAVEAVLAPGRGPIARATDWKCRPLPARRSLLPFERTLAPAEVARLARGLVPQQMEDRWFVYLEDSVLRCHRSWTGLEHFRAHLAPVADRPGWWAFARVKVARAAEPSTPEQAAAELSTFSWLVEHLTTAPT